MGQNPGRESSNLHRAAEEARGKPRNFQAKGRRETPHSEDSGLESTEATFGAGTRSAGVVFYFVLKQSKALQMCNEFFVGFFGEDEMKFSIITNNPLVVKFYEGDFDVQYFDISIKEIMQKVRDLCGEGHELLTHPLSGSVKPGETPYKSVLVSAETGKCDVEGYQMAQTAMEVCDKFSSMHKEWSPSVLDDFQLVDYTLISSGIESATA